ncbi:1,2-diacylglycerol 3-alpha-glucosyltransferase [Ruminococcaceae bacterium FB2012]|nr:1,2-diacylglycerol 3-alpha-glucosyltransferase [Ruminococcaceae bacterium FB2012]
MRIVIIRTNTGDFGKVGTYNVQEIGLANALMKMGHKVNVLFLHKETNRILSDNTYKFVYYLPHKSIGLHGIFDVRILDRFKPDRIILFSDNQLWAKNVIMWCRKKSIPCIQYMGGVLSDNPGWLHQFYTKLILIRNIKSYHYSINAAKTTRVKNEMIKHKIPFSRVISIGLDAELLSEKKSPDLETKKELHYSPNDKIILFVGRIIDYKKPFLACDIAKKMHKEDSNYKLILIGKGPLQKQLKDYIRENKMNSFIEYIERVPYEEMYKYMVASDCLINLSSKEIFGMTILEAMYYGLPVVAHKAPGPNDVIDNGKNGILCNTDDVNIWCALIEKGIKRKDFLGNNARQTIKQEYLWDSIANEFVKL